MTISFPSTYCKGRRAWIYFFSLALCVTLLFLVGLGNRHFTSSDEPRVAGISAEMARSGDLLVPRLNGEPFLEKPPLYFWISSATFKLLGESAFTARLPSAVAAICGVFLVFFLARSMGFSALTAFISGFILATSPRYWAIGHKCIIDMMLCLFTTCSMLCFFQARCSLSGRTPWYIGFVLSLSAAVITKGLVGIAIPLSILCVLLLVEKDFSFRSWSLLFICAVLCLMPTVVWIWFLYRKLGWNAIYEVVWINNFSRFTGSYPEHIKPFYYYIINFPQQFFPWVFFLPIALICYVRKIREQKYQYHSLFLIAWFAVPFLLLSISAGKRDLYLLPIYPAAALLVGTVVGKFLEGREALTKWFSVPSALLSGGIILASLSLFGLSIYLKESILTSLLVSIPGLCLGLWAYCRLRKKDLTGFFKIAIAALVVIFLAYDYGNTLLSNQRKSYEPLFQYCKRLDSEGVQVGLFMPLERIKGAAVFYLKKTVPVFYDEQNLKNFLHSGKRVVAISEERSIEELNNYDVMKRFKFDHRTYVLVGS